MGMSKQQFIKAGLGTSEEYDKIMTETPGIENNKEDWNSFSKKVTSGSNHIVSLDNKLQSDLQDVYHEALLDAGWDDDDIANKAHEMALDNAPSFDADDDESREAYLDSDDFADALSEAMMECVMDSDSCINYAQQAVIDTYEAEKNVELDQEDIFELFDLLWE
jgi:hypothetical protein